MEPIYADPVAEARERLALADKYPSSGEPYVDDADLLRGLLAKIEQLAESAIRGGELLAALIRQIELGEFRDQHGHPLTNNVHFIKAKEAVGE